MVMGLIVMIVVQAMLNMMVAVGLFPVTGQTLPMVSWGRTSVLMMSFSIGAISECQQGGKCKDKE